MDADAHWNELEATSLTLESLVSDTEKPALVQARGLLKEKEHELQKLLNTRYLSGLLINKSVSHCKQGCHCAIKIHIVCTTQQQIVPLTLSLTNKASKYGKRFVWAQHSEAADPGHLVLLFGTTVIGEGHGGCAWQRKGAGFPLPFSHFQ